MFHHLGRVTSSNPWLVRIAWLGVGTAAGVGAGVGGGAAAATLVAWPGGVQLAGGTNALLGSAGRGGGGTAGTAGDATA